MIRLDQKAKILLGYFRENKSQRQLSRELGISRTTVQKYIKEYELNCEQLSKLENSPYQDEEQMNLLIKELTCKPRYNTGNRIKVKLTDEVATAIDELVDLNAKNKLSGKRKQLMKKIDIHEELLERGYDIGYTTVCNYIRDTYEIKEAFIRQQYGLGETLEFDWGIVRLNIAGEEVVLHMGLFTTAIGSYHYARLYQNQKMENFLDIHVKAFDKIGGVHQEIVYDNMKQAVKRFVVSKEKEATDDLIKLSLYYGFKYRFCNGKSGHEKGHVERGVEFVRRKVFSLRTSFDSMEDANKYMHERLLKLNLRERNWLGQRSPKDMLNDEKPYLLALKPAYDTARRREARVSKYSVINIDQNKYSVPDYLVGKFVLAKVYPEKIKVYYRDKLVAHHKRSYSVHHWTVDINHFIHTLKKKPGALHSSVGRHQLSPRLQEIYQEYYSKNPRDFIALLEIIKEKDLEKVLVAIEELKGIKKSLVTTENIRNIVYRVPTTTDSLKKEDRIIQKASLDQISVLNKLFNLTSIGGCDIGDHNQ